MFHQPLRPARRAAGLVFCSMVLLCAGAEATVIHYDVRSLGGNTWEYSYEVTNDTLAGDIEEFTVFFDLGLYENLSVGGVPPDWDPLVIQPDPALPDDGFYDALALGAGIAPGESLGGFSVRFDFLGAGTPGAQFFDIVDPFTFASLDSGTTVVAVPEPGPFWLLAMGIAGIGVSRARTRR